MMFSKRSAGPPRERLARVIAPISSSQSTEAVMRRNWPAASSVANQLRWSGPVSWSVGSVMSVVSGRLRLAVTLISSSDRGSLAVHWDWMLIVLPALDQGVPDPELIEDAADDVVVHLVDRSGPRVIGHRRGKNHGTGPRQIVHIL